MMNARRTAGAVAVFLSLLIAAPAARADTYTKTRYPLVLAHGLSGFSSLLSVLDYWYGIGDTLKSGGAAVYVTDVSAFDSSEERGEQLLAQVERIVAQTGCGKVNLIGHSQGGLDVRYVLAMRPDLVASVTTVGTPHLGSELADFLRKNINPGGFTETVIGALADSAGWFISLLTGQSSPQDSIGALATLTSTGTATFNAAYPAGMPTKHCGQGAASAGSTRFYSWGGTSVLTNVFDVSDAPLALSGLLFHENNDGLVGQCSAHFGSVIRDDYSQNHLDEVNQVVGLTNIFATSPKSVFRSLANRLKNAGL
jgi:triacylglycerol lipase